MATLAQKQDIDSTAEISQYLTFLLNGESYGVDILRVQEIRGWHGVTRIPNTPQFMRGVINMRGTIVPVIDLRRRFNIEEIAYTATTVVLVLKVAVLAVEKSMGIIVDAVSDVCDVALSAKKSSPDLGASVDLSFIEAWATQDNAMLAILNIDTLLKLDDSKELRAEHGVSHF